MPRNTRLFKLIISPEFGDRLDLEKLIRELMRRMEKELQTRLEWAAVTHFDTEHPHVHIALRGIRDTGASLQLNRDYIKHGIRTAAEDLCTLQLGYGGGHLQAIDGKICLYASRGKFYPFISSGCPKPSS